MENFFKIVGLGICWILLVCVVIALPTMLLWNWLMPVIFSLTKIGFWQALGLNLLGSLLVGGAKFTASKL